MSRHLDTTTVVGRETGTGRRARGSVLRVTAPEHPARLTVGVVGAGRVGSVLGAALARAGHAVGAVSAVSQASLARAATLLPGVPVRPVDEVVAQADLVLLAVPDDVLGDLVAGLCSTQILHPGQILVHTSGRHGLAPLRPARELQVLPAAMHPAMTFSGTSVDLDRLTDCCFGVTAPEAVRPIAEALVLDIGGEPVWVAEAQRPRYHAALTHGANHLVTVVAQSLQILREAGIDDGQHVLRPLVEAALDNALRAGDAALTGPVARGDIGTVQLHLGELGPGDPDVLSAYRAMAGATAQRAVRDGRLSPQRAAPLIDLLTDPPRTHES